MTGLSFFWQQTPKSVWLVAPASERESIVQEHRPPFCTVLDVDNDFTHDLTADEHAALKYLGNFYVDLDGDDDLDEVIAQFKKLLSKLEALGLSLAQCHLAATGGRGFHIEIPLACMMPTVPQGGIVGLPGIFRELAQALYVETLDLRVYSAKRGRAWRVPGIERENGLFKVPLTPDEALSMTPERYSELCSTPRYLVPPDAPTLNSALARMFSNARDKASAKKSRARVAGKVAAALKKRFVTLGYPLPPSLLGLASGRTPAREGAGFNQIVMQLSTVAVAMGVTEDQLVDLCAGFIQNHIGDGSRYSTPRKRENELRKMHSYMEDSPYDPSIGGIRSILPKNANCADLKGL